MTAQAQSPGFTLIELMVALAIVALLLFLGMPSFTTFIRNSEIRSTAESLINGLRAANTQAANLNRPVTFTIRGGVGASWTGWDLTYVDENAITQTVQQYARKEAGSGSSVTPTPADKLTVIFNSLGRVDKQGTPNDHIQTLDICIDSCVVGYEYRPLKIIVDDPRPGAKSGLRMCDPDPALAALVPRDPRAC